LGVFGILDAKTLNPSREIKERERKKMLQIIAQAKDLNKDKSVMAQEEKKAERIWRIN